MSTLTASAPPRARALNPAHVSFGHLVRAEWIKLTSVRSTWWSIGMVAVVSLGLSLLMASAISSQASAMSGMPASEWNKLAIQVIVFSTVLTQLLAVILGAINVTGEYSTGMIRSTLTAAPGRLGALLAKALVVGLTMFVTSIVIFGAAALITAPIMGDHALDFGDAKTSIMPLLGAALYLALMSIMGVGLGFAIRNGPGALSVGIGLVFVAPIIVNFFPRNDTFGWIQDISSYFPSNAGQSLFLGGGMSGNALDTLPALITIVLWAVVALVAGAAVLKSRDA